MAKEKVMGILESMTKDAFDQFTRYGSGVHNIEIAEVLEALTNVNDDFENGRHITCILKSIEGVRKAVDELAKKASEIGMALSNDEKRRIEESLKEIEACESLYIHPDQARLYLEEGYRFDPSKVKRIYIKKPGMEQVFRNMPTGFLITAGMLRRHLKDVYSVDFDPKIAGIPDIATIPANAVWYTMEPANISTGDHNTGFSWVMNLEIHLLDKFSWVTVTATVEKKQP